jgi:CRP/FNR family cyclic AMP-dependent transcriptional regulator
MESGIEKEEYRQRFAEVLFFRALSAEARDHLFDRAEAIYFEAGELIVLEGDLSPSFFALVEGSVIVSMKQDGKDVYINTLGRGEAFGEAAMFLKAPRTADVKAADPTVVLKITRYDFMDFLKDHPREGNKALLAIIYGLITKLRSSNQELVFERRGDAGQADVDALVAELTGC